MNVLELKQLTKIYGDGETAIKAVDSVDLIVKEGEIILIMGPSGSGKTTLLSMAGALLRPTSGEIIIQGKKITDMSENELPKVRAEYIGFIFQSFNLLANLTAFENVAITSYVTGKKNVDIQKRTMKLLEQMGLSHRLHALPANLSGGEKQRVAIARALMNDPKIILADEPTANLDSKKGHDVLEQLQHIAKNEMKSVVIVSHDSRIKSVADRILWLEDGKFKELAKMTTDPICDMSIEKGTITTKVNGKEYFFCSMGCKKEFEEKQNK